ncbi:MAG TPA: glutathione S-transferase family protein [Burkholderiaceae bacterium]|nr:glutathione S-transferase family protein [Burkholderiaceae bacterium]
MLTLYHSPNSRSSRFIWLLEELGVEHEIIYCDIKRRSGIGAPDARNPHPEKRVPALSNNGELVTEQVAIALYLTDTFPMIGLGVPAGAVGRAAYLSWLGFYASEVDPIYNTRSLYGDRLDSMSVRDCERVVARVSTALARGPYLLGNQFSAADILVSGPFEWDPDLVPENTVIKEWLGKLSDRPAARRAAAKDNLAASN